MHPKCERSTFLVNVFRKISAVYHDAKLAKLGEFALKVFEKIAASTQCGSAQDSVCRLGKNPLQSDLIFRRLKCAMLGGEFLTRTRRRVEK